MRHCLLLALVVFCYAEPGPVNATDESISISQNVTSESLATLISSISVDASFVDIQLPDIVTTPCIDLDLTSIAHVEIEVTDGVWCGNIHSDVPLGVLTMKHVTFSGTVSIPYVHELQLQDTTFVQDSNCCDTRAPVIDVPHVDKLAIGMVTFENGCRLFGSTSVANLFDWGHKDGQNVLHNNAFCHEVSMGRTATIRFGKELQSTANNAYVPVAFKNVTGTDLSFMCGDVNKVYNMTSQSCISATCESMVTADHMCATTATTAAPDATTMAPDSETKLSTGAVVGISIASIALVGVIYNWRKILSFFQNIGSNRVRNAGLYSRSEALRNVL